MDMRKIYNPNVTFVASDEDWLAMSNKNLTVSWAYLTGRLKIQGSHTWWGRSERTGIEKWFAPDGPRRYSESRNTR
jgi:hypothetical protein